MSTANTPANTPDGTTANTTENTPGDSLGILLDQLQSAITTGAITSVELFRLTAAGREPVQVFDGDKFDPFKLGVVAGKYMARLKVEGKYVKSATFSVSGPTSIAIAQTQAPAQPGTLDASQMMMMMMNQAQQGQQMMMQLFTSSQQQMTTLLTTVLAKKSDDRSPVSELIEGVERLKGMSGESGTGKSDVGELAELAAAFAPMLSQQKTAQDGSVTLTREQVLDLRRRLAAKQKPKSIDVKPIPGTRQPAVHVARSNEPAASSLPAFVPEIGRKAIDQLRACYVAGISTSAAGVAIYDLLDTSPEGPGMMQQILDGDKESFLSQVGEYIPQFKTEIGRNWLSNAIDALREEVRDAAEAASDIALSDETDDIESEESQSDQQAA